MSRLYRLVGVLAAAAACCLVVTGCGKRPDAAASSPAGVPPAPGADRAGWPATVRVGLVPTEGGADTKLRFAAMEEQLRKELQVPVELVSPSNYQGVITAMANKQLEFAYFGPKSYVEAAKRAGAEALLVELNKSKERGYRCIFIVPANSPITSLQGAKGKKFAFTDPNSTSGCLIPSMLLFDISGLPAEQYFGQVTFSGSHGTSILQVAAGELDIAATNDLDFGKVVQKGAVRESDVRVVYTSDLIPGSTLAGRADVPPSLKKAFIDAMTKINTNAAALEQFQNGGFEPVTDREYDVIRATQDFVEKRRTESAAATPAG